MKTEDKNVLIADDDDDDFEIFNAAMSELSFKVLLMRAENGEILLKVLDEKIPDILFLDLFLSGKNGWQCLKEIRSNTKYDLLPVIIYSSLSEMKEIEFCFREGANLYVVKPTSFGELKNVLTRILSIDWKKSMYFPSFPEFVISGS